MECRLTDICGGAVVVFFIIRRAYNGLVDMLEPTEWAGVTMLCVLKDFPSKGSSW